MFDSMAMDAKGNVCVAALVDGGIRAQSPKSEPARHMPCPDPLTTNNPLWRRRPQDGLQVSGHGCHSL